MKNFRTKVFKQAHELMRATGKAFAVCLSKAWALYRLTKRMRREIVTFAYEKADGSLRKAKGTLQDVQTFRTSSKAQVRKITRPSVTLTLRRTGSGHSR